jgi:hypothetical protein
MLLDYDRLYVTGEVGEAAIYDSAAATSYERVCANGAFLVLTVCTTYCTILNFKKLHNNGNPYIENELFNAR